MPRSLRFGDLDRWLSHPDRLLIVAALAERRWHESGEISPKLGMRQNVLSSRLARLRQAEYVERERHGTHTVWRLTGIGSDRFAAHLAALQAVLAKVIELVGRDTEQSAQCQRGCESGR